jgi:hypothetical protein
MTTSELIAAIEAIYGIDLSEYTVQSDLMGELGEVLTLTGIRCHSRHFEDEIPHMNPSQGSIEICVDLDTGLPVMVHRQGTKLIETDRGFDGEIVFDTISPGGGYIHSLVFRKKNYAVFSGF